MKSLVVIPARYGSIRLPAKPLAQIAGITMLARMIEIAKKAAAIASLDFIVATDHQEIATHAQSLGARAIITDPKIPSGSDRCFAAAKLYGASVDLVINLQGDAPFTPPAHIASLVTTASLTRADIYTLGIQLSWDELDLLRTQKKTAPFSGTTCVRDEGGRAIWFSKKIIPAIRNENELRAGVVMSPVIRHIGVYGYRYDALSRYVTLAPSPYEKLEGLEQLRAIEAGMHIHLSLTQRPRLSMSGIDSPEDIVRAEKMLESSDDPYLTGIYI